MPIFTSTCLSPQSNETGNKQKCIEGSGYQGVQFRQTTKETCRHQAFERQQRFSTLMQVIQLNFDLSGSQIPSTRTNKGSKETKQSRASVWQTVWARSAEGRSGRLGFHSPPLLSLHHTLIGWELNAPSCWHSSIRSQSAHLKQVIWIHWGGHHKQGQGDHQMFYFTFQD